MAGKASARIPAKMYTCLCVCLSKYEIEELFHTVHEMDPHAFITLQEGVRIYGNFQKKLE